MLVAGSHHPLVRRSEVGWKDLAKYPWIVPPPGASMREPLERILAEHDLAVPKDRVESVSMTANKTLLQATLSLGFFSRRIAEHYQHLGLVSILPMELRNLVGPVGVMWIKDKPLLPADVAMLEALVEVARVAVGADHEEEPAAADLPVS